MSRSVFAKDSKVCTFAINLNISLLTYISSQVLMMKLVRVLPMRTQMKLDLQALASLLWTLRTTTRWTGKTFRIIYKMMKDLCVRYTI